jgi:hypothetical protein
VTGSAVHAPAGLADLDFAYHLAWDGEASPHFSTRRFIFQTSAGIVTRERVRGLISPALGNYQGNVVVLFVGAELADFIDDGGKQGL